MRCLDISIGAFKCCECRLDSLTRGEVGIRAHRSRRWSTMTHVDHFTAGFDDPAEFLESSLAAVQHGAQSDKGEID